MTGWPTPWPRTCWPASCSPSSRRRPSPRSASAGFPFVTQVLGGSFSSVQVTADDAERRGGAGRGGHSHLDATLTGHSGHRWLSEHRGRPSRGQARWSNSNGISAVTGHRVAALPTTGCDGLLGADRPAVHRRLHHGSAAARTSTPRRSPWRTPQVNVAYGRRAPGGGRCGVPHRAATDPDPEPAVRHLGDRSDRSAGRRAAVRYGAGHPAPRPESTGRRGSGQMAVCSRTCFTRIGSRRRRRSRDERHRAPSRPRSGRPGGARRRRRAASGVRGGSRPRAGCRRRR